MIVELLGHGKENALTRREIMTRLNIRSDREFYDILSRERLQGALILTIGAGYFKPCDDPEQALPDMLRYRARQIKAARSIYASLRSVTKAINQIRRERDDE